MSDLLRQREAIRRRRQALAARRDLQAIGATTETVVYATQPTKRGPLDV